VLQAAVSWHLAREFAEFDEGRLTFVRAAVVCNRHLAHRLVRRLGAVGDGVGGVGGLFADAPETLRLAVAQYSDRVLRSPTDKDFLISGDAAGNSNGGETGARLKCLADTYEALVAAVLLDADGDLDRTWRVFREDFVLDQALVEARVEAHLAEVRARAKQELTHTGPAQATGEAGAGCSGGELAG